MVDDGNDPLTPAGEHLDDLVLEEYVLGQLPAYQEAIVRQHVDQCPWCRARDMELRAFCGRLAADLQHDLEIASPQAPLSFDPIARQWREPRRRAWRVPVLWRLPVPAVLALGLLAWLALSLLPERSASALRALALPEDYDGPPAVVAAVSSDGLVVMRLGMGESRLERRFSYVTHPANLQISPDGEWLVFAQDSTLHVVTTRTDGPYVQLPLHEFADWAWSPDGQALAFTDGTGQLWVFNCQTQAKVLLVPAEESAWGKPLWNPDGSQIAYAVARPLPPKAGGTSYQSLWRVDVRSGLRVELARRSPANGALIVPALWLPSGESLIAWEMLAGADGGMATLYRVDVNGHSLTPLGGQVPAQGMTPLWPIGPQARLLTWQDHGPVVWYLADGKRLTLSVQTSWLQTMDWSPNGLWLAYTVGGAPEGQGVYTYAIEGAILRPVPLPGGATERMVIWGGLEHLFVVRQPARSNTGELWLVPLAEGETPRRLMSRLRLPGPGPYNGWRWNDVVAIRVLGTLD